MAPQKQKTTKNKPGARRKGLDVTYQLRFTLADRKAWEDLAEKAGMELSQWIRLQCARAANAKDRKSVV